MSEPLLTPADVATLCQISSKTVLRAIHRGGLRASRLGAGGAYRMRSADVDAWIDASTVTPSQRPVVTASAARVPDSLDRAATGRLKLTASMGRH